MNKLKELLDQLRGLDPNDPGRWPVGVRLGTAIAAVRAGRRGRLLLLRLEVAAPGAARGARQGDRAPRPRSRRKARKAANLQAYKDQLAEMEKSFGAMLRQLPNKTEVPNLLVDISQTGLAAGLEEKLFQPQGEARKDFYAELPISIRLTGDYHQMGNFASGIAALPRIVTLHDIEIAPAGGKDITNGRPRAERHRQDLPVPRRGRAGLRGCRQGQEGQGQEGQGQEGRGRVRRLWQTT